MSDRKVKRSKKDANGNIVGLCNPDSIWLRRSKSEVISDIKSGNYSYYVLLPDTDRADIIIGKRGSEEYLKTSKDNSTTNNLDSLPDC